MRSGDVPAGPVTSTGGQPIEIREVSAVYVIIAPIQIKEGHKDQFIEAIIEDAKGSVNDEPGCLRFDVVQDAGDPNRIWLYEVYEDEAAFQAHTQAPHFIKFRDATQDIRVEGIQGAARGSSNVYPPDAEWKK
jgi:quinol monooxygenase YgiN